MAPRSGLWKAGSMAASRWETGVAVCATEEKDCIRGLVRFWMEGWGVGRWVVVMFRAFTSC